MTFFCIDGCCKGTQCLDLTLAFTLALEAGLDLESMASLAQADVKAYYDSISLKTLAATLVQQCNISREEAGAVVRVHSLPGVTLQVGAASVEIPRRYSGLMIGSASAWLFALIPIADCCRKGRSYFEQRALRLGNDRFGIACWADNVFALAPHPDNAIESLEHLRFLLKERWRLDYGEKSCEVFSLPGAPPVSQVLLDCGYKPVQVMKTLGHYQSNNGGFLEDEQQTKARIMRSFGANLSSRVLVDKDKIPTNRKIRLLDRAVLPTLAWSAIRWARTPTRALWYDKLQADLVSKCLPCRPNVDDSSSVFFRRRLSFAKSILEDHKPWSERLWKWQTNYVAHLGRHEHKWACKLRRWRPSAWYQARRLTFAATGTVETLWSGRTNTRAITQRVAPRWSSAFTEAGGTLP